MNKRRFIIAILICLLTYSTALGFSSIDPNKLEDGDIVFQTTISSQTVPLIFATASLYTHVGIVQKIDDEAYVIEAVGPVRVIPWQQWVAKGYFKRVTVKRFKDNINTAALFSAAKKHMGKPYDPYFLFDKKRIYCSELVYYAFKDSMNIELGEVQKARELYLNNMFTKSLIKRRWGKYEPCKGISDFEACYQKILDQELVTPESVAHDDKLQTVFSNYY